MENIKGENELTGCKIVDQLWKKSLPTGACSTKTFPQIAAYKNLAKISKE